MVWREAGGRVFQLYFTLFYRVIGAGVAGVLTEFAAVLSIVFHGCFSYVVRGRCGEGSARLLISLDASFLWVLIAN